MKQQRSAPRASDEQDKKKQGAAAQSGNVSETETSFAETAESVEDADSIVMEAELVDDSAADANSSATSSEEDGETAQRSSDNPSGPQSVGTEEPGENPVIADLTQQLLRTRADFDNFRRRTRQEKEELQQFATRKFLEQLLPVVDNFERALASFGTTGDVNDGTVADMKTGLEMVHRQLLGVLEQQGVQSIEAIGQPFNPNLHEAVMQETVEGEAPGKVIAELQRGYSLHDKVLRPAMVKVTS